MPPALPPHPAPDEPAASTRCSHRAAARPATRPAAQPRLRPRAPDLPPRGGTALPRPLGLLAAAAGLAGVLAGCEPYRIEYHRRPAFYEEMSEEPLPDQVVLPDGTLVVYSTRGENRNDPVRRRAEDDEFTLRAEGEDGSVELRSLLPEHVLAHALTCIRAGEYRLMWDQLVAERTKLAYAEQGLGFEDFEAFMIEHRVELARMLNRMSLGINMHECAQGYAAPGIYRVQFHPRVVMNSDGSRQFRFTKVDMTQEGFQMKLVLIH